jgi:hypothetical protein
MTEDVNERLIWVFGARKWIIYHGIQNIKMKSTSEDGKIAVSLEVRESEVAAVWSK